MRPSLYERYPRLTLPRVDLGSWPTPIRELRPGLWVKDEGLAGPIYGGNKVRKLEMHLGSARAQGISDILTLGAVGSHHVLATALYARHLGMRPYAVLFPQPDTPHVRENARLIDAACEGWGATPSMIGVPWQWIREWSAIAIVGGRQPFVIGGGGSDPTGTAGWVSAGLELADDVATGRLPRLDRVFVAMGSCGTVAGLLLGLRVAGLDTEVVAVRVVDRVIANASKVRRLFKQTHALLRSHGAELPDVAPENFRVVHDFFGGAYGRWDDRVTAAVATAGDLGLHLETTYTGKAFAAALADPAPGGTVDVFVSTVNQVPLDDRLAEALPDVPERMKALLLA